MNSLAVKNYLIQIILQNAPTVLSTSSIQCDQHQKFLRAYDWREKTNCYSKLIGEIDFRPHKPICTLKTASHMHLP